MGLPKREKEKLKRLKKKGLKRKKARKLDARLPIPPPGKRHKSKKDYKRTKKVDYD
jgi:hypothetical protein